MNKLIAIVLFFLAPAASAQDGSQTPEGAQLFLSKIAAQGATTLGVDTGDGINIRGGYVFDFAAVLSADSGKQCVTRIRISPPDPYVFDIGTFLPPTQGYGSESPISINWSKVSEVSQSGEMVIVRGESIFSNVSETPLYFKLTSAALATRVAYAMDFLRIACDQTGGTGF